MGIQVEFATGRTSAACIEKALRDFVDPGIVYKQQTRQSFVSEVRVTLRKSELAAETIAGIYDGLEMGHDRHFLLVGEVLGGEVHTMEAWIEEHAACFHRDGLRDN